jgi:hypothetical protein
MDEFFVLLSKYVTLAGVAWDYVEPERLLVWNGFQDLSREARRAFWTVGDRIQVIARIGLVWAFVMIGVAMFCPPHAAHTVIPILALVPILLLGWFITEWTSIAIIIAIAAVPQSTPGIGKVFGLVQTAIKKVVTVLVVEMILGIYLSLVPISKDPGLVPLLLLVAITLGIVSMILGKGWVRSLLIILLLGLTIVFFLGGRDKAGKKLDDAVAAVSAPPTSTLPASYRETRFCPASERDTVDFFDKAAADIPSKEFRYRPVEGCWAELVLPGFSHNWNVQTAANLEGDGSWMAVRCMDGRISFPPQSPNSNHPFGCGGRDAREKNTLFLQGNTELFFKAP